MEKNTTCIDCGKNVTYTTKKPHRCPSCVEKFKYMNSKIPHSRSKLEYVVQEWLDELFISKGYNYIANGFYSWIRSPKDKALQLDFLLYSSKGFHFAIEIDGKQHYQQLFYQTEQAFNYLHDCDILKSRALRSRKIPLVRMKEKEEEWTKEDFIELLNQYGIQL